MPSIQRLYVNALRRRFGGYRPVWSPLTAVLPGDVLVLDPAGAYQRVGTLRDVLGDATPPLAVTRDASAMPIDFVSTSEVEFDGKLAGETSVALPSVPQAKAGFAYHFRRQGEFVLYAETATESEIGNLITLERPLNAALRRGDWEPRFILAAKVLATPTFSLIIAETDDSRVEFVLEGTLVPSIKELGKAGVSARTVSARGLVAKFPGITDATPLIYGVRLVPIIGRPSRIFHHVD